MHEHSERMMIVGAGPVGLGIAAALKRHGVAYDHVEADSNLGGNWFHGVYRTAHIISSRRTTEFSDFPMPAHYPEFPSAQQILSYLQDFAQHHGLRSSIEFNSKVVMVRPRADELWSVTLAGGEERIYKGVFVCTGHHWSKRLPSFPGDFAGEVIHGKDYKDPKQLQGKRVLVVGGGNSACDIASEAARCGIKSHLSLRRGHWFMPKTILGKPFHEVLPLWTPLWIQRLLLGWALKVIVGDYRTYGLERPTDRIFDRHPTLNSELLEHLKHGRVSAKPDIRRFNGSQVEFADGSVEEYDLVVYATGYQLDFPFLPRGLVPMVDGVAQLYGNSMLPDYKHIYILGTTTPRYGFGPLLSEASNFIGQLLKVQDNMTLPIGYVLKHMGQKPLTSAYVDAGHLLRQLKRGSWLLPLLLKYGEKRLLRKRGAARVPVRLVDAVPSAADVEVY